MPTGQGHRILLYALLILSGSAGLAYQTVWTKTLAVTLGHEMPSLIAVVAAFFLGLSLGAWSLGQRIGRSLRPQFWYAGLELAIAAWAVASLFVLPLLAKASVPVLGIAPSPSLQWLIAFALPFFGLLPATVAMGATLPAMEQVLARGISHRRVVGGAYAANTGGALLGVVGSVFWLLPLLGQRVTVLVFATVNLLCAIAAVALVRGRSRPLPPAPPETHRAADEPRLSLLLVATGALGIGYEVLAVRIMSQVFEGTLYSYATALAVYLAASSIGAAMFQRHAHRLAPQQWLQRLLIALAAACLLGLLLLYEAQDIYRALRIATGDSTFDVLVSELALALGVYLVPSLLMGATFALLAQSARNAEGDVGRAFGLNALGSAVAPLIFGVVLLPAIGARWALGILALAYVALLLRPHGLATRLAWLPAVAVLAVVAALPALRIVALRDGEQVLSFREGVMASAAVVEKDGVRNLRVNNRYQMGGTSPEALLFQRRQAHIPLLLHSAPRSVLVLGVASGATVGAAAQHANVEVDAVELVPEVLELLGHFKPENGTPQAQPNVRLHAADARRFVRASANQYDVVIADLFHPARDGAGLLFTKEHYRAVSERLAPGGVFCHWLPFHQLDLTMARLITRTFLSVFDDAQLLLASDSLNYPALGLVTGLDRGRLSRGYLARRVTDPALRKTLQGVRLDNDLELFSTVLLDRKALVDLAGSGPLNTDDLPLVSYRAPRFTYQRGSVPHGRLMSLVRTYASRSPPSADMKEDPLFVQRLGEFVQARNLYLHALEAHTEDGLDAALSTYLASARTSTQYRAVFEQLFRLATLQADRDPAQALAIAETLHGLRPDVPAVRVLLDRLRRKRQPP